MIRVASILAFIGVAVFAPGAIIAIAGGIVMATATVALSVVHAVMVVVVWFYSMWLVVSLLTLY